MARKLQLLQFCHLELYQDQGEVLHVDHHNAGKDNHLPGDHTENEIEGHHQEDVPHQDEDQGQGHLPDVEDTADQVLVLHINFVYCWNLKIEKVNIFCGQQINVFSFEVLPGDMHAFVI